MFEHQYKASDFPREILALFDKAAATLAWQRTIELFKKNLA